MKDVISTIPAMSIAPEALSARRELVAMARSDVFMRAYHRPDDPQHQQFRDEYRRTFVLAYGADTGVLPPETILSL